MIKACLICKNEFYSRPSDKKYKKGRYCSKSCSAKVNYKTNLQMFKKGYVPWNKGKNMPCVSKKKHWNWKGGRHPYGEDGYIYILNKKHPLATKGGYVAEHRLVMERSLGRYLKSFERVHHINGNRQDNRKKNLRLFANESKHRKFHLSLST